MKCDIFPSLAQVAMGKRAAQLVFKNGKVINVFTGELLSADVAVNDGIIVGVGSYEGETYVDLAGKYICPGFLDAHLHMESTLVTPAELTENTVKWGTTTYIVDPHESANVKGAAGIDYILSETERVPANVYVMMPSCVPAMSFEDNGCAFPASEMEKYLNNPRILGLGEVMDYYSVVNADKSMMEKLSLFENKIKDGHAPFLGEKDLNAYALAGIQTDHECTSYEYAMAERRAGMHIHIREGSAAKNLEAIVTGLVKNNIDTTGFSFCTDDKHVEDIRREGHISFCIKKAISIGLDPIKAIQMATINTARCYQLKHLGAVAPGYQADLVILDDLKSVSVSAVYHKGKNVAGFVHTNGLPEDSKLRNTVHLAPVTEKMLEYAVTEAKSSVIGLLPGQIVTEHRKAVLPQKDGIFAPNGIYNKIAVIERHHATGKIGVGAILGFGIANGAIASSVSHDSHNITVIGDNDRDMLAAVGELARVGGGYTIASGGKTVKTLPLPIMGLMSDAGFDTVNNTLGDMIVLAHQMGVKQGIEPFITLSFMALPVIPELRLTPRGLYDVSHSEFIK